MTESTNGQLPAGYDDAFDALAHSRRRCVLRALDETTARSVAELATDVAAAERDRRPDDVSSDDVEAVRIALHHVHLPALVEAGLVERTDGAVRAADHPALDDPAVDELLRSDAPVRDDVLRCLAVRRRRTVLGVLRARDGAVDREALAGAIATRLGSEDDDARESILGALHHVHLPALDEAGLVDYDPDEGTVAYEGHPDLADAWFPGEDDSSDGSAGPRGVEAVGRVS